MVAASNPSAPTQPSVEDEPAADETTAVVVRKCKLALASLEAADDGLKAQALSIALPRAGLELATSTTEAMAGRTRS